MAQIRETLTLEDKFSATFTRYLRLGEQAAGAAGSVTQASKNYQSVLSGLDRRLIAANAQFDAYYQKQRDMLAIGQENTAAFLELDAKMNKVGETINALQAQYDLVQKQAQQAEQAVKAQQQAEQAAAEEVAAAIERQRQEIEKTAAAQRRHQRIAQAVTGTLKKLTGIDWSKPQSSVNSLTKQLRRFSLTLFSVSRIFNFAKSSLERAPLSIQTSWSRASESIAKLFRGPIIAALDGLSPALERLTAALNSESGQRLARSLQTIARVIGRGLGAAIDIAAGAVEWLGENLDLVAVAAGIAGAAMVISAVSSAAAWVMANWQLLLVVAAIGLIIAIARQAGATWEEIGGVIGGVFGEIYAFAMNQFIVPLQNGIARIANFLGNVFNHPIASVKILFYEMVQSALGYIRVLAHGIEDLLNSIPGASFNFAYQFDSLYNQLGEAIQKEKSLSGWKEYVKAWDYVDYAQAWEQGSDIGASFGAALDNFKLDDLIAEVSSIGDGVNSIAKDVDMSKEDLRSLVDVATRRYVNNINLSTKAPVITVYGQNTGNTRADTRYFMDELKRMLAEDDASGSVTPSYQPF